MEMPLENSHTKNWPVLLNAYYVANTTLQCRNATSIRPDKRCKIKIEQQKRMTSAELANAILDIKTGLKRDNIIKHVTIMTEILEAVTV